MKKLSLPLTLFSLFLMSLLHAQIPGTPCAPINLGDHDTCTGSITISQTHNWYQFTANNYTAILTLTSRNITPGVYSKLILYSGYCDGLTKIDSVDIVPGDSVLTLTAHSLQVGGNYLAEAIMIPYMTGACRTCLDSTVVSSICLTEQGDPGFCAFDLYNSYNNANNPPYTIQLSQQDQYILNYVNTHTTIAGPFTIPVVVHVVHNGNPYGSGVNIPYEQIQWQIAALNAGFQRAYAAYNQQTYGHQYTYGYQDYSTNPQVRFCLAHIGRDTALNQIPFFYNTMSADTECGVMRYDITQAPFNAIPNITSLIEYNTDSLDEGILMNLTRPAGEFPVDMYLNIYLVGDMCSGTSCNNVFNATPGIVGIGSMLPNASTGFDGIVMRSDAFGDNSVTGNNFALFPALNQGKIADHETGHYLSLYHTFQPDSGFNTVGCYGDQAVSASSFQCNTHGDFCCDTPPDATALVSPCNSTNVNNSCNETYFTSPADHADMEENYMDYKDDDCYNTFTYDQSMRISAMLDVGGPRHSLVTASNLALTGLSNTGLCSCCLLSANISVQPSYTCPGQTVNFFTPSGVGLCATSWSWQFPGGTPSSATGTTASTVYNTPGFYLVRLTAYAGIDSVTEVIGIQIASPSVTIRPSTTDTVCNHSQQSVYLNFGGGLRPYNVTLCNQNGNVVATLTNFNSDSAIILVSVSDTSFAFHICAAVNALGCPLDTFGSASFQIMECCPNLFVDGDFESYGIGCNISPSTTEHHSAPGCALYTPGYYGVYDPTVGNGWSIVPGMTGVNGFSMAFDGYPAPLDSNITPFHVELWSQSLPLENGVHYSISFDYSGHYWNLGQLLQRPGAFGRHLYLQFKVNGTFIGTPIHVPDFSIGTPWHTFVMDWTNNLPTGTDTITLCQVQQPSSGFTFDSNFFDFLLDNISIRAKDIPTVDAGMDTLLCPGNFAYIGSLFNDSDGVYSWLPVSFVACDTCLFTTANPIISYDYVLTNQQRGCIVMDTVLVTVLHVSGNDTAYCGGGTITLNPTITANPGGYTVLWQPGGQTTSSITISPTVTSTYIVTVTDTLSHCTDSDTITVYPGNLNVSLYDTTVCTGNAVPLTPTVTGNIGNVTYLWLPGNQTTSTIYVFPSVTTTYTLIVTDSLGCSDTATSTVTPGGSVSVSASAVPNPACIGGPVQLSSTVTGNGPYTYSWSPATSLSSSTVANPSISTFTGTPNSYTLTVTNSSGCSGSTIVNITPDSVCCLAQIVAPDTLNNITITASSMAVNNDLYITGTVTISGTDVLISTGVQIYVLPGATLVITNQAHLHACLQMWNGISVDANGTLLVINNSLIEDAYSAARTSGTGISTVILNTAIFNKNLIDVDIQPCNTLAAVTVTNCRFTCRVLPAAPTVTLLTSTYLTSLASSNLIAPLTTQKTFTAVNVLDVNAVIIGVASVSSLNIMDNMEHGIYGFNSDVNSFNNLYQDMAGVDITCPGYPALCPPTPGIAILLSDPTVDLTDPTSFNTVNVGGFGLARNYFVDCFEAVDVTNYVNVTITNDTVYSAATVINPPNVLNLNGGHGIFVRTKYFQAMEINNNSIVNQATGIHLILAAGGASYPTGHINNNNVIAQSTSTTFTNTGIFAEGVTGVLFAPGDYLFIDSNTVVNAATCIHGRNFRKIGLRIEDNPLLHIRPITTTAAGPNYAGILVQNCNISTVINNSINSTGTTITNPNHRNVRGIYMMNTPNATVTCNQILNTGQSLVFESGCYGTKMRKNDFTNAYDGFVMRNSALIGVQGDINNPIDNQWIGTFTFSETFVDNVSNINSLTLGSPIYTRSVSPWKPTNNQSNPAFNEYFPIIVNPGFTPADCGIEQFLARKQNPDPDEDETAQRNRIAQDQINYAVFESENSLQNQKTLQAELEEYPSLMDGDTVLQNFNYNNQNSNLGKMNEVENELGQGNSANAISANAGIVPTTTPEINLQQYNSIYLNSLVSGIDSLSSQQISDLMDIALQCPSEGGEAVWEARALLNWALHNSLDFSDSCYSSSRLSQENSSANPLAEIYPNPNDGKVTLIYDVQNITTVRFEICDALGRILFATSLDPAKTKKDMELIGLANGAYIYKLIGDDAIIASGTLIISR